MRNGTKVDPVSIDGRIAQLRAQAKGEADSKRAAGARPVEGDRQGGCDWAPLDPMSPLSAGVAAALCLMPPLLMPSAVLTASLGTMRWAMSFMPLHTTVTQALKSSPWD